MLVLEIAKALNVSPYNIHIKFVDVMGVLNFSINGAIYLVQLKNKNTRIIEKSIKKLSCS
jgi:hypothetical protein